MTIPAIYALSFFALFASCTDGSHGSASTPRDDGPIEMQRVFTTQESGFDQPHRLVIRTPNEWQSVWQQVTRGNQQSSLLPAVDFRQSMIILAATGRRNTGGHEIKIVDMSHSQGGLAVIVQTIAPGANCMTIQALTSPVDIVQVLRSDERVDFVERQEVRECD
jgi:hypothetical protein